MKLANTLFLLFFVCSCVKANDLTFEHYKIYTNKVASCILKEKSKKPISPSDFKGISKSVLATSIFYLKEKRIVDCSAHEELNSISKFITDKENSIDLQLLSDRYLSFSLISREKSFLELDLQVRNDIYDAVKNRNLEVNLLELFDSME